MTSDQEEWREIPGYGGRYEVSNLGRVRSLVKKAPRILKYRLGLGNYPIVCLCRQMPFRADRRWVHQLVLEAFVGPRPTEKHVARHLDDVRTNNVVTNLEWGTRSENIQDAFRNGRMRIGSKHPGAKVSEQDVVEMRRRRKAGESLKSIARAFGLTESAVSYNCKGRAAWRHDVGESPQEAPIHIGNKLTAEKVREIRRLVSEGVVDREIALRFGVDRKTISNVRRGLVWAHVQ